MNQYKLTNGGGVLKLTGNEYLMSIPCDEKNHDWQEYQAWLAAGNTPDVADVEPETVIRIPKLEFKKRLQALGKYEAAATALASLSDDLKENWDLVDDAATDNEPLMALLTAIGVTDLSTIFY